MALVKRETGVSPVRTRHRNKGAEADISLGTGKSFPGKMADAMIFKPGDLPDCSTETIVSDHE